MNQNNKTGHFTCYKNRTFSFATDTYSPARVRTTPLVQVMDTKVV